MRGAIIPTLTLALFAAACQIPAGEPSAPPAEEAVPQTAGAATGTTAGTSAHPETGAPLPPLDLESATVPLEDIHFNTFDGRSVALSRANEAQRTRLRDAIAPIYRPTYESPGDASSWLRDDDVIIGVTGETEAFAYPHRVLNFHEIVHETIDGVPMLITYCPLCRSGIVYDRRLDGRTLTFGNTSALYESDLVMFDWETHSYWWQVAGRGIVGTLAGEALTPLPAQTMTWAEWRRLHPGTHVLQRPLPRRIPYHEAPFDGLPEFLDGGRTPFPTSEAARDDRLSPSTLVLGIEIDDENHVYPIPALAGTVLNTRIAGEPVIIIGDPAGESAAAFIARHDGQELRFEVRNGGLVDVQTGSAWDRAGRAVDGPLEGVSLDGAPSRTTFWFAYIAAFPDSLLHLEPAS